MREEHRQLREAVRWLSLSARRAMLGAARTQTMRCGSWQGCAFNAAGAHLRLTVASTAVAATAFGMSIRAVLMFIKIWDSLMLPPDQATKLLISCIEEIGDQAPVAPPRATRDAHGLMFERILDRMQTGAHPDETFALGPAAFTAPGDIDDHERIARVLLFDREPTMEPIPRDHMQPRVLVG